MNDDFEDEVLGFLMKAIIVNQAIPGTTEAFKRVRARRPDILLLAGEPHEDPLVIQSAADVAASADFVSRGYTIIWAAKQLGAKTFVHISFPRHMSYESLGLRRQIMEEACKDLGLKFVFETAPDPTSDVGQAGAQQFILEKTPQWIEKYGKDTAFFCTNDGETEPLLRQMLAYGGIFVEADLPSPLMGVNNRDLRTFTTDLGVTERLSDLLPEGRLLISESGVRNAGDIVRLRACGARGFLIGETLMRAENPEESVRSLVQAR